MQIKKEQIQIKMIIHLEIEFDMLNKRSKI